MSAGDDPQDNWQRRSSEDTVDCGQAWLRRPRMAETRVCGQARQIAGFLAAGPAFPSGPYGLRAVDEAIDHGLLRWLDALLRGRADLRRPVSGGDRRTRAGFESRGLSGPRIDRA